MVQTPITLKLSLHNLLVLKTLSKKQAIRSMIWIYHYGYTHAENPNSRNWAICSSQNSQAHNETYCALEKDRLQSMNLYQMDWQCSLFLCLSSKVVSDRKIYKKKRVNLEKCKKNVKKISKEINKFYIMNSIIKNLFTV